MSAASRTFGEAEKAEAEGPIAEACLRLDPEPKKASLDAPEHGENGPSRRGRTESLVGPRWGRFPGRLFRFTRVPRGL